MKIHIVKTLLIKTGIALQFELNVNDNEKNRNKLQLYSIPVLYIWLTCNNLLTGRHPLISLFVDLHLQHNQQHIPSVLQIRLTCLNMNFLYRQIHK